MKKYLLILLFVAGNTSIIFAQESKFGASIDEKDALSMQQLVQEMDGKASISTKVSGKVIEVCQVKGCWMKIDKGDGTSMRVRFKDYGFFVPKNSSGKTAVLQGIASVETTTVEELKHYAEDAGKPKEEIEKITEPQSELVFEAEGVILKD